MAEIGLFPLPIVLLPSEQVPLHIFEERYKELIGECLAESRPFGVLYAQEEGVHEVGTQALVTQVLTRFDDGRLNILVEGGERFHVDELTTGRTFQTGITSPLADDDDPADPETVARALELFERLREVAQSEVEAPAAESDQLSYALAARVELEPDDKQALLEAMSERTRLERVCELLEGAARSVEIQRRAAERAATNGKVDLG
jgi:Lon protease-like protein